MCVYREDEGRELCRKRGSEFKLPYPIIDINGCDSPQTGGAVTSSTGDEKCPPSSLPRPPPAAVKKPAAAPRNQRKRKKDPAPLSSLYNSGGNELKSCSDLVQQYQAGIAANGYHPDVMFGCGEYGRMIVGCPRDYDVDDDVMKMRHDVTGYYGNAEAGAGAWHYWGAENSQLASYLYGQQRYLSDYSMYGGHRLMTSPPPSLSNGYV